MIDDVVGDTPVVILQRVVPPGAGSVRVKLELNSPNGTLMDRLARVLAREAGPGPWREAGDGALAIAVAMQGALHGQRVEVFLPEGTCLEVRQSLLVYRANLTLTPFANGPRGSLAAARSAGPVLSDRFPGARAEAFGAIGRELLASEERIDAFVAPRELLETIGPVLREKFPAVQLRAWQPVAGGWRPHRQAGVFSGPEPEAADWVDDETAWAMRTRLGREEGLLVSIATAAGIELARRGAVELGPDARVYALAAETGERDFSLQAQF